MRWSIQMPVVLLSVAATGIVLLTACSATLIYCWSTNDPDVCGGGEKSAAASPGDALQFSASAHAAGAAGTNWRTDVEVHCWSDVGASYTIDPHSGVARHVGPITGFEGVNSIDFDDASGVLYGWNHPTGLMTIKPATGAGADVNPGGRRPDPDSDSGAVGRHGCRWAGRRVRH